MAPDRGAASASRASGRTPTRRPTSAAGSSRSTRRSSGHEELYVVVAGRCALHARRRGDRRAGRHRRFPPRRRRVAEGGLGGAGHDRPRARRLARPAVRAVRVGVVLRGLRAGARAGDRDDGGGARALPREAAGGDQCSTTWPASSPAPAAPTRRGRTSRARSRAESGPPASKPSPTTTLRSSCEQLADGDPRRDRAPAGRLDPDPRALRRAGARRQCQDGGRVGRGRHRRAHRRRRRPRRALPRPQRPCDVHGRRRRDRRPQGTIVFVRDPSANRKAVAREAGTTILSAGGKPGEAFTVSDWERASRRTGTGAWRSTRSSGTRKRPPRSRRASRRCRSIRAATTTPAACARSPATRTGARAPAARDRARSDLRRAGEGRLRLRLDPRAGRRAHRLTPASPARFPPRLDPCRPAPAVARRTQRASGCAACAACRSRRRRARSARRARS